VRSVQSVCPAAATVAAIIACRESGHSDRQSHNDLLALSFDCNAPDLKFDLLFKILARSSKEISFFSPSSRYERGLEFYHSHFKLFPPPSGSRLVDCTPNYIEHVAVRDRIVDTYVGPPLFANSDAFVNTARLHTLMPLECSSLV